MLKFLQGRFSPLTIKVNLLVLVTMIVGIGAISILLAGRLFQTIDQYSEKSLTTDARIVYAAIETLMLPGQAELAQGYFSRMRQNDAGFRPSIYRLDGTEAFVDNATLNKVNDFLKILKFPLRTNPATPVKIPTGSEFVQAATGPALDIRFETKENGQTLTHVFKPILNLPKCTYCHGSDHTFRGILSLTSDISQRRADQQLAIVIASILFLVTVSLATVLLTWFLGRAVLRPVQRIAQVCSLVTDGDFDHRVEFKGEDELAALGGTVNTMIDGLVERFKLSKFVSGSTIQSLQSTAGNRKVRKVVLFSDIRGFTAFADTRDPALVVATLNRILNLQTDLIQQSGGDIDKYVGDEIFAIFDGTLAELRACEAALAIQRRLGGGDGELEGLQVGIGVHAGEVIEGMVGSDKRADYTLIGDTVNLGARLCAAAPAGDILLSEAIIGALKALRTDPFSTPRLKAFRLRGPVKLVLKGKQGEVPAYRLSASVPKAGGAS